MAGDVPDPGHAIQGEDADAEREVPVQAGAVPRGGGQGLHPRVPLPDRRGYGPRRRQVVTTVIDTPPAHSTT